MLLNSKVSGWVAEFTIYNIWRSTITSRRLSGRVPKGEAEMFQTNYATLIAKESVRPSRNVKPQMKLLQFMGLGALLSQISQLTGTNDGIL